MLRPTLLQGVAHKKQAIEDARSFIQTILVYDSDGDKEGEQARLSKHFCGKLLDEFRSRTRLPSSAHDVLTPEDELVSHEIETILVAFGRKKPKV